MPFWVDDGDLCERVLMTAKGMGGKPVGPEITKMMGDMLFGMESRFVTRLEDSPVPFEIERRQKRARNFVVRRGLVYIDATVRPNLAIVVPPHFVTDHASVPAALRWLVPQSGVHSAAAVIHDWLYTVAEPPSDPRAFQQDRRRDDRIFLNAMNSCRVAPLRRALLFNGARQFGAGGYGAVSELRFIDPDAPDRLIDPTLFSKAALRAFTIIPRPEEPKSPAKTRR
jgi:hypothetical protein